MFTSRTRLSILFWLILPLFLLNTGCDLSSPEAGASESSVAVSSADSNAPATIVDSVCQLSYKGEFDEAESKLNGAPISGTGPLAGLSEVVKGYEEIEADREVKRKQAFEEQMSELRKLEERFASRDGNEPSDVNGAADANTVVTAVDTELEEMEFESDIREVDADVNEITEVFSVVVKAKEYADEAEKKRLLNDSFVKATEERAVEKATAFEAEGKWFDSYVVCYSWLASIHEEQEAFSDYADELLDKANIVASLQDSPCETRKERYTGVDPEMFVRAIDALNFSYVSLVDYQLMAIEAVERCRLLGEVMTVSYGEVIKDANSLNGDFEKPAGPELSAWNVGLGAIKSEMQDSVIGVSKEKFIETFENVLALNRATIELPERLLIVHFLEAALAALDPYTVMVWPKQVEDFEKMMTSEFTGIGVEISKEKGQLTVGSLLLDTPAFQSGLDAGDIIEAVDGVATKDMSVTCAVKNITGPAGTKVTLRIRRPSEDRVFDVTIKRARIVVPTIRGWQRTAKGEWLYMLDEENKIGYVRMTQFAERTADDLDKVLAKLEKGGMEGLILDLRYNTGGLLHAAIEICDKFVSKGLIVGTQPRFGVPTWASATKKSHPYFPMVILINGGSASASEIMAGCLGDPTQGRAVLVGDRTYGKGLVQGITRHPGGGAQLKYTMAHYLLPSGKRVESQEAMKKLDREDWGVGPDVAIKLRTDELRNMLDIRRDNEVLVKADHDEEVDPVEKHTSEELMDSDPQLAIARLVVRAQQIQQSAKK